MVELAQEEPDIDTPVNPYSLLEAVNRSSDMAHTGWLIFLGVMAYLMIAVAGVTHRELLLDQPVQLPIFNIQVPQVQFFIFAPVLLVLFHLGIVTQLVLLARKTLEFDLAVQQLESSSRRTHPLRLELHNFFYVQAIAGSHRSIIMGAFLHGMSWLTLVAIPVLLLLFVQMKFLPYHDVAVTWAHRIALSVDILMMLLIGVFLVRPEVSFFSALGRTIISHPMSVMITSVIFGIVTLFSYFVATVPGETLDRYVSQYLIGDQAQTASAGTGGPLVMGFALPFSITRPDGSLFGVFHRNLIVSDVDLVPDDQVTAGEVTISLRGRDLRFARLERVDLHQADLTEANLDGASLAGSDLRDIRFQCADVTIYLLTNDRARARCPSARGANFSDANLQGSQLRGLDLTGARLDSADLRKAAMSFSVLVRSSFNAAQMQMADLSGGVKAQGASFVVANLEGADLNGAQLQAANFSNAVMPASVLSYAQLEGAKLWEANLEGAEIIAAQLRGADFTRARLNLADLRWSTIWDALPPPLELLERADFSSVTIQQMTDEQLEKLKATLTELDESDLREVASESSRLARVIDPSAGRDWSGSADRQVWDGIIKSSEAAVADPLFATELSASLAQLACDEKWSNGAVATGVARRVASQQYRGDVAAFYARFSSSACGPADQVAKGVKDAVSIKVRSGF